MIEYKLEHLFNYNATLTDPEVIGPVADGIRLNFYVTGGKVKGPKVEGKLRGVGADWFTVKNDGVGMLDVRTTIETHDGALIYVTYSGILDLGKDGYKKILQGNMPESGAAIRTSPRCQTAHPDYEWLNRLHCLGIGQAFIERNEVIYDVYAVR